MRHIQVAEFRGIKVPAIEWLYSFEDGSSAGIYDAVVLDRFERAQEDIEANA